MPLDPWERWAAIHAGELLPDGRPRFRKVLIVVGRQNGKTHLLVVLSLYWLCVVRVAMVLGTSTKLDYAKESWSKACRHMRRVPALDALLPPTRNRGIRQANGEQELVLDLEEDEIEAPRYKIAPANEEGGRSLSLDRAILDELRQHHDYSAWDAIVPAANAVPDAQIVAITNMGDDRSVVLNDLIDEVEHYLETGEGDDRLGGFLWTNLPDANPCDLQVLAQSNPNLGRRIDPAALLADAEAAVRKGGEKLAGFMTEIVCARVKKLNPAIDPNRWSGLRVPGTLDDVRDRVAMVVDVAPDGQHATLTAAATVEVTAAQLADAAAAGITPGTKARPEVVKAWDGPDCIGQLRADLPELIRRTRPRVLGWYPGGPAAAITADLAQRSAGPGQAAWPPPGVRVEQIKAETSAVCMGLAALVAAGDVVHSGDPLQDAHISTAEKLMIPGERWVFSRRGGGHCDAAYSAAGAVHLARLLPPPKGRPRIVRARRPPGA